MKAAIFCFATAALSPLLGALEALDGHVDLLSEWSASGGAWSSRLIPDDGVGRNPDAVFLPLADRAYAGAAAGSGARVKRSANPVFDFTGVGAGEPLWVSVKGTAPVGDAQLGFGDLPTFSGYGSYLETDPRVLPQPQTLALPWIRHTYQGMTYLGAGEPHFSVSDQVSGSTVVWISTANGQADNFILYGGSHNHLNWWFSAQGVYRIAFTASAFRGPGKTNPTGESAPFKLTFAVGPVARWQAEHFSGSELESPEIAGISADPDGDGLSNLIEYAFGLDPRSGTPAAHPPGLGLPVHSREFSGGNWWQVVDFPRRRSDGALAPLQYSAEFSTDPAATEWLTDGEESVAEFTGDAAALNAAWELVRVRRAVPPGQAVGFGRIRVLLPE